MQEPKIKKKTERTHFRRKLVEQNLVASLTEIWASDVVIEFSGVAHRDLGVRSRH